MIKKLDSKMDCIEITVLGKHTECLGFDSAKEIGKKLNELVDTVNRLEESVQGVVNNSIADGGRIQSLQEQIHALKTRLENVQSDPETRPVNVHKWIHWDTDAARAIHKATESANKNLVNALTVAVDALKQIADCSPNKTYSGTVAQQALTNIATILKVRQKVEK